MAQQLESIKPPILTITLAIKSIEDNANPLQIAAHDGDSLFVFRQTAGDGRLSIKKDGGVETIRLDSDNVSYITGGNVGIGTNAPLSKFNILGTQGNWRVDPDSVSNEIQVLSSNTANTGFRTFRLRTNETIFDTGGSERMRILSDGKVGIGTTAPAKLLTVRSATSPIIGLYSAYADSNARNWSIGTNNAAYGDFTISASAANGGDPTAIKLSILKDGNVGIGTVTPSTKLHVLGSGATISGGETTLNPSGTGTSIASKILSLLNTYDTAYTSDALTAYNATTSFDISNKSSYTFFARPKNGNIFTSASETTSSANFQRYVNLNSSATEPLLEWAFYQYDGTGTASSDFKTPDKLFRIIAREGSSNNTKFVIKGNGNVGIGTNNPLNLLMINGSSPIIRFRDSNATGTPLAYIDASDGALKLQADASNETASSFLTLEVDGSEHVRVVADGNVGIGTTAPVGRLHASDVADFYVDVDGTDSAVVFKEGGGNSWRIGNRANGDKFNITQSATSLGSNVRLTIDNGGNVGIGDNLVDPEHRLHVAGDAIISGYLYDSTNSTGVDGYVLTSKEDGPQWKMIEEVLSGVGGNGTANYIPKWEDEDTIGDSVIAQSGDAIGIGTAAPATKLHVEDSTANTTATKITVQGGSRGFTLGKAHTADNYQHLKPITDTAMALRVMPNGTTAREAYVEVWNKDFENNANSTSWNRGMFYVDTSSNVYLRADGYGTGSVYIGTENNTQTLTIQDSGNVGIGVTSANAKLKVVTSNTDIAIFQGTHATTTNFYISNSNATANNTANLYFAPANKVAGALIQAIAIEDFSTSANRTADLAFQTRKDGTFSEKMRILAGGNVGINTTTPGSILQIKGDGTLFGSTITVRESTGTTDRFYGGLDANEHGYISLLGSDNTNRVYLSGGSSISSYILNNVGIGTNNPAEPLHVRSTSGAAAIFERSDAASVGIRILGNGMTTSTCPKIHAEAGPDLAFTVNNAERMRILSDGKVGIGTTNPGKKLQISAGDGGHLLLQYSGSTGNSGAVRQIFQRSTGTEASPAGTNDGTIIGTTSYVAYAPSGSSYRNSAAIIVTRHGAANTVSAPAKIALATPGTADDTLVDRLTVLPGGSVGIGTTNPIYTLHVKAAQGIVRTDSTTGTNRSGFQMANTGGTGFIMATSSAGNGVLTTGGLAYALQINKSGGSTDTWNAVQIGTKDIARMTIDESGNVGIGTNNPTGKFQIGANYTIPGTSYGGDDIYIANTGSHSDYDPYVTNTDDFRALITISDATTEGPTKPGLILYNDSTTAGGFSPMLLFAKRETGASPYKAATAAIYARSPLGTGNSNSWIDGELIFATAGAATNGIRQRMVINKEGLVGIGTNNPSERLHVYRVGILEPKFQSSNGRVGLQLTAGATGDANWILYSGYPAAGDFTIREGGVANHIVIKKTTGYVGIGTTNPGVKLNVVENDANWAAIIKNENANGYGLSIDCIANTGTTVYALGVYTGAGTGFFVRNKGNVGIGTAQPGAAKLDIYHNGGFTDDLPTARIYHRNQPDSGNNRVAALDVNVGMNNGDLFHHGHVQLFQHFTGAAYNSPKLYFSSNSYNSSTNHRQWWGIQALADTTATGDRLAFTCDLSSANPTASPVHIMSLLTAGNVGIGVVAPDNYVNIRESALSSRPASNSNTSLTIEHATDTGIQFFSATQTQLRFGDAASTAAGAIIYEHGDDNFKLNYTDHLTINGSSSENVRFLNNGSVGIGTTSPQGKVDIYNGGISLRQTGASYYIQGQSYGPLATFLGGSTIFRWDTSNAAGNVGVSYFSISVDASGNVAFSNNSSQTFTTKRLSIATNGALQFGAYGSGTHTGTAAYKLAVDSSGNLIETAVGSGQVDGSGTANYVAKWTDGDTIGNSSIFDNGSVGIGTNNPSCLLQLGTDGVQGGASLAIRRNGDSINFGHVNGAGYGSVIGCSSNNGYPHIGFMCEAGTNINTFRTRGLKGNVIFTNTSGTLNFGQVTNANADNQSVTTRVSIESDGDAYFFGGNWFCNTNNSTNVSNGGLYINRGGGLYAYALAAARSGTALNGVDFWDYHGEGLVFGPDSSTKVLTVKSNVGIGTTAPEYLLHVQGTGPDLLKLRATTSGSATAPKIHFEHSSGGTQTADIVFDQSGQNKLKFTTYYQSATDGNLIQFAPADTVAMTIRGGTGASDGFVGIGTVSPAHRLDVNGGSLVPLRLVSSGYSGIEYHNTAGTWAAFIGTESGGGGNRYNSAASKHTFYNNSSAVVTINSSGNVGIGTTSPSSILQIKGDGTLLGSTITVKDSTGTTDRFYGGLDANQHGYISLVGSDNTNRVYLSGGSSINNYILNNVGIGTNAPANSAKLDVRGRISVREDSELQFGTHADYAFMEAWDTSADRSPKKPIAINPWGGSVGIGTTSPAEKLEVLNGAIRITNTAAAKLVLRGDSGNSGDSGEIDGIIDFRHDDETYGYRLNAENWSSKSAFHIQEWRSSAYISRLYIDKEGNVGIGTTNPTKLLTVNGQIGLLLSGTARLHMRADSDRTYFEAQSGNGLRFTTTGGGSLDILNGGSVGIGTTSPNYKLQVVGTFRASDSGYFAKTSGTGLTVDHGTSFGTIASDIHYFKGNVGINQTTPYNLLHVNGNGRINSLIVGNSSASNTPAAALHIKSSGTDAVLRIEDLDSSNQVFDFLVDQGLGFQIIDKGTGSSTNPRLTIDTAGNVGIGITAPANKLEVNFTGDDGVRIQNTASSHASLYIDAGTGGVGNAYVRMTARDGTNTMTHWINLQSNGNLVFRPAATGTAANQIIFNQNGSIGIGGTPTSGNKLFVNGNSFLDGTAYVDDALTVDGNINFESAGQYITFYGNANAHHSISSRNSSGAADDDIRINTYGGLFINLDSNGNDSSESHSSFQIGRHAGTGAVSASDLFLNLSGETGKLRLYKYGSGTHTGTVAKALGVDSSGNVIEFSGGTGTVTGSGTDNYVPRWNGTTALQNSSIYARDDGHVGIGTTGDGTWRLRVEGGFYGNGMVQLTNTNGVAVYNTSGASRTLIALNSSNQCVINQHANTDIPVKIIGDYIALEPTNFIGAAVEAVRVIEDGNVGIGITNPGHKLHVKGSGVQRILVESTDNQAGIALRSDSSNDAIMYSPNSTDDLRFYLNAADRVTFKNDGNVGIGTATPRTNLHVYGTGVDNGLAKIRIGGNTNNTAILELAETQNGSGEMTYGFSMRADGGSGGGSTNDFQLRYHNSSTSGVIGMTMQRTTGQVGIGGVYSGTYRLYVYGDGYMTGNLGLGGTLTEASSLAIKENIETFEPSLDIINKIRPQ